jgi:hypothetical protein
MATIAVPRRFVLNRIEDDSGISGVGLVAQGVEFADGRVALRWLTEFASTAVYDSMVDVQAIHGHNGHTRVDWID